MNNRINFDRICKIVWIFRTKLIGQEVKDVIHLRGTYFEIPNVTNLFFKRRDDNQWNYILRISHCTSYPKL